jgi:hypothetical protein
VLGRGVEDSATATHHSQRIAQALLRGRRVAVVTDRPIDDLAREVWDQLSPRQRARKSLATWAFGVENGFDLVGLPARPNVVIPEGYIDSSALVQASGGRVCHVREDRKNPGQGAHATRSPIRAVALLAAALGLSAVAGAWFAHSDRNFSTRELSHPEPPPLPVLPAKRTAGISPESRRDISSKLREMSRRFGVEADGTADDPAAWMRGMASSLRYRGPLLSPADLVQLRAEREAGRARALDWDRQIRLFLPDRPLPGDFEDQPLTRQLSTFAWSFHLTLDPRLTPAEIPEAIGYALAVEGSTRSNPLSKRYPALGDYARFLDRLPRR